MAISEFVHKARKGEVVSYGECVVAPSWPHASLLLPAGRGSGICIRVSRRPIHRSRRARSSAGACTRSGGTGRSRYRASARTLELTFKDFEALLERLNAGEPVPNARLAEYVEILRACASGEPQPNAYLPPTDRAPRLLRQMFWALESLERGESGAAGEFVRNAGTSFTCFDSNRSAPREPAATPDTQRQV